MPCEQLNIDLPSSSTSHRILLCRTYTRSVTAATYTNFSIARVRCILIVIFRCCLCHQNRGLGRTLRTARLLLQHIFLVVRQSTKNIRTSVFRGPRYFTKTVFAVLLVLVFFTSTVSPAHNLLLLTCPSLNKRSIDGRN